MTGTVTNTGDAKSSAVAQLYVRKPGRLNGAPERELVGFWRSSDLQPGSRVLHHHGSQARLAVYDDIRDVKRLIAGLLKLAIMACSWATACAMRVKSGPFSWISRS